jgi:hypothetical protein
MHRAREISKAFSLYLIYLNLTQYLSKMPVDLSPEEKLGVYYLEVALGVVSSSKMDEDYPS